LKDAVRQAGNLIEKNWYKRGSCLLNKLTVPCRKLPKIRPKQSGKIVEGVPTKGRLRQTVLEMNAAKVNVF
jgi:hypothetical protein